MTTEITIEEMNVAIAKFLGFTYYDHGIRPCVVDHLKNAIHVTDLKYHEDWNQLHIVWNKLWYDCSIVPMKHELEWSKIRGSKCARAILYRTIKEAHKEIYEAIVFYTTTKQKD